MDRALDDMIASYGLEPSSELETLFDSSYLPSREARMID
jgi:NitT/TauT family transport system substrate-binding protein